MAQKMIDDAKKFIKEQVNAKAKRVYYYLDEQQEDYDVIQRCTGHGAPEVLLGYANSFNYARRLLSCLTENFVVEGDDKKINIEALKEDGVLEAHEASNLHSITVHSADLDSSRTVTIFNFFYTARER